MNAATESIAVPISIGTLDCAVDSPPAGAPAAGCAIVAHPHPLHGGTRDNKVTQTLARALAGLGYTVWRPNFRGVGTSSGEFDNGVGETDDLLELVAHVRARQRGAGAATELVLAGFSFGSYVVARVAERLAGGAEPAAGLILVGVATSRWQLPVVPATTLVVHGELDETVPLASVFDWARPQGLPVTVIPGADHFFHQKLVTIKSLVLRHFAGRAGLTR